MKHRQAQCKVKLKQVSSVIQYPPGYKGQPLTQELIGFSERLDDCPEEYRGIFHILIKQFAYDMGCGDSERSREYLKAIACGGEVIWCHEDLPSVVFISMEVQRGSTRKRVLKIMPTSQLIEINEIAINASRVYLGDAVATDTQPPLKAFIGTFTF